MTSAACALLAWLALTSTVRLGSESEVILSFSYEDTANGNDHAVEAVTVVVDEQRAQEMLVFPGSGKRHYEAILGPLAAGAHTVALRASQFWPSAIARSRDLRLRIVDRSDEAAEVIRHAPAFWARADTVGASTDLPLVMYVESTNDANERRLTYSVIFSNEDGGTATRALMARWGRTSDIEWMYAARLTSGGTMAEDERFQAANHGSQPFLGTHIGAHPVLLVSTLNNLFADRGAGLALIRPVPRLVDLSNATRESVMDLEPWTYGVMARELVAEKKIDDSGTDLDPNLVADPRSYVYAEAKLTLDGAAVAAYVEDRAGVGRSSHLGRPDLAIARSGWVRVAVPVASSPPHAVGWQCLPLDDPNGRRARAGSCRIEAARAFRLQDDYRPGPNLIEPTLMILRPGELKTVGLAR